MRLLEMPAAIIADREQFPDTWKLVTEALGGTFTVRGINDLGMAELWISEYGLNSDNACDDSVWIERDFLKVVR